jgi:hypothetical protein
MTNELKIKKMANANGIKRLNLNCRSNGRKDVISNSVIYAGNGIFKSSFSNAFHGLINAKEVKDRISEKPLDYDIYIGNKNIKDMDLKEHMIVFSNDIMSDVRLDDMKTDISRLAIIDELSDDLKRINSDLDSIYKQIELHFIDVGFSSKEMDLLATVSFEHRMEYLDALLSTINESEILDKDLDLDLELFRSPEYLKINTKETARTTQDFKDYIKMLSVDPVFDEDFNVFVASDFLKDIKKAHFIDGTKGRTVTINDQEFVTYESFEKRLHAAIKAALGDEQAERRLGDILKKIGNRSNDQKKLKKMVQTDLTVIEALTHSKEEWISSKIKKEHGFQIDELITRVNRLKDEIRSIQEQADEKQSRFERAILIFEDRFDPNFKVSITNKRQSAVGIELPVFSYEHRRAKDYPIDENRLSEVLSSGETTTYNIIKFIAKYENIKENNPVVILDDVVDSFDYGNRYAFIEYIKEMIENGTNVIALTNNYDFFRSLKSRVYNLSSLAASINVKHSVLVFSPKNLVFDTRTVFNIDSVHDLIMALPFARELATYNNRNMDFIKYFHIKRGTKLLNLNGLKQKIAKRYKKASFSDEIDYKAIYLHAIDSVCDDIIKERIASYDMKKKIVLAMNIRLKLEVILLEGTIGITDRINRNQTSELIRLKKHRFKADFRRLVDQISVCTPEFLHLNAFMYEPLIDVNPDRLVRIYRKLLTFIDNGKLAWDQRYK